MVRMLTTWFYRGRPEYEAGKEYTLDPGLERLMVLKGAAAIAKAKEEVKEEAKEEAPAKEPRAKKRSRKKR